MVTVKHFESRDLEICLSLYLAQRVRRSMNETTEAATSIKDSPVLLIDDRGPRVSPRKPNDVGK